MGAVTELPRCWSMARDLLKREKPSGWAQAFPLHLPDLDSAARGTPRPAVMRDRERERERKRERKKERKEREKERKERERRERESESLPA